MKSKEILLLYKFRDTETGQRLYRTAARMGILCRVVEENQTEEKLGALLKLPGFQEGETGTPETQDTESGSEDGNVKGAEDPSAYKPTLSQEEAQAVLDRQAMVMYGFSSKRLDDLLKNMRKAGLPVIPLKAIVTPYNVNWTFRELYMELVRENEAMHGK